MVARRELLDEVAAAERIGMSIAFLRAARCRGTLGNRSPGPPYLQLGRSVRYDCADLDKWLDAQRVDPAARSKGRVVRRGVAA